MSSYSNPAIENGIEPYEGVLLAYLPPLGAVMQEHEGREYTLYSLDGVAYDCMPPMKWWRVKDAARALGLSTIEPIWSGAAADFRVPEVPRPENHKLYLRAFSGGPWICLEDKEGSH